jgi:hypothetical protein
MSTQIQRRRGTTAQHSTFTGAVGEVTVDTDKEVLVVHDGAQAGGYPQMRENGSNSALALGSAGTPSLKFSGDPNTGIYSPGADQLAISTDGVGRLFVTGAGRVGIGTASPAVPLVVTTAASGEALRLTNGTNSERLHFYTGTNALVEANNSNLALTTKDDKYIVFSTTNTERMRLDSSGRLGLGTSSPGAKLEVAGDVIFNGGGVQFPIQFVNAFTPNSQRTDLLFAGNATSNNAFRLGTIASNGGITLQGTRQSDSSQKVNLILQPDGGSVGIGTQTAGRTLSVDSAIQVSNSTSGFGLGNGLEILHETDGETYFLNRRNANMRFYTNNTERGRWTADGKLLVGTSSAVATFNYAGADRTPRFQVVGDDINNGAAAIIRTGTAPSLFFGAGASGNNVSGSSTLSRIVFSGFHTDKYYTGAEILALVDGTPGASDMPSTLVFSTTADGASSPTERARITNDGYLRLAGKGIQFNGDTADANSLDDYEEGTWTPAVIGSTTAGTATYSIRNGRYTKIGNVVHFELYVDYTGGTGAGNFRVDGLPFSPSTSNPTYTAVTIGYLNNIPLSANHTPLFLCASGSNYIYNYQVPSGGGTNIPIPYSGSGTFSLSGTYTTA